MGKNYLLNRRSIFILLDSGIRNRLDNLYYIIGVWKSLTRKRLIFFYFLFRPKLKRIKTTQ